MAKGKNITKIKNKKQIIVNESKERERYKEWVIISISFEGHLNWKDQKNNKINKNPIIEMYKN